MNSRNPYLAVSVSGGGALGVGPLHFIRRLEADLGNTLASMTGAVGGTSTGSIIAAMLASGFEGNFMYEMYRNNLKSIFTKYPFYKRMKPSCPTYDNSNLTKLLKKYFDGFMPDFQKIICIPTTCTNGYNVEKVWDRSDKDCEKWFAVLSSCSAPTYFSPVGKDKNYIDGGMWANDPICVLQAHLASLGMGNMYRILSFNTGMRTPNTETGDKSLVELGKYIIGDWVARTGAGELYKVRQNIGQNNVFRLEPSVNKGFKMDNLDVLDEGVS